PELLDHLAAEVRNDGWSIKRLIRRLVTSETWRRSSEPSARSLERDPDNVSLSHYPVRRLEAEAIRDALLTLGGELRLESMQGEPVRGTEPRRSIYVRVKRNDLDPFLTLFDAPVPASTTGDRDDTNVPGQSLTLLNDPFVLRAAERWAARLTEDASLADERALVGRMFVEAIGRGPTAEELDRALAFLGDMKRLREESARELAALKHALADRQERVESLEALATKRVLAKRSAVQGDAGAGLPSPVAAWDFARGVTDMVGTLDAKLHGGARIEDDRLKLDGRTAYVATTPLTVDLRAKTLEAWVRLEGLDQQGGGVMTVQTTDGNVFDALVYGESERRHWVAGSDFFRRSRSFGGPAEEAAGREPVHFALVYRADGHVTLYRNGERYGQGYDSGGPVHFKAGQTQVLFGNRHGEPGGNRMLKGAISRARLYDRALTPEEIQASFRGDANFVSDEARWAALNPAEQQELSQLRAQAAEVKARLESAEKQGGLTSARADLAHALFNLKEFIYLR
ncbi:MAG TPA: hypothetical protein DCY13_07695, partial [Verrucomicrobiales bacterium]|nr:hypothetical protein [Verrucomicrobiales bacterium]